MPAAVHTPPLPGLSRDEEVDTVINWGLGADSTAYLARMLTDPAAHGIDLERTVVLYMATGSEWPEPGCWSRSSCCRCCVNKEEDETIARFNEASLSVNLRCDPKRFIACWKSEKRVSCPQGSQTNSATATLEMDRRLRCSDLTCRQYRCQTAPD